MSSGGSSSGEPLDCRSRNHYFACEAIDCAAPPVGAVGCGDHHVFDLDGCMRPWCQDDSECSGGDVCYRPTDCDPDLDPDGDGCVVSEIATCDPQTLGDCVCLPFSCPSVGWCIPASARPC